MPMLQFKGSTYAEALATIHALCFSEPWSIDTFQKLLILPTTFGFGNDKGFILYSDLGQDLEILTLAVHPDFRHQGIAFTLLKTLQDFAIKHNKKKIFLEVNETNIPAISLYQKAGFLQTGKRPNYYHQGNKTFDALCFYWQQKTSD